MRLAGGESVLDKATRTDYSRTGGYPDSIATYLTMLIRHVLFFTSRVKIEKKAHERRLHSKLTTNQKNLQRACFF